MEKNAIVENISNRLKLKLILFSEKHFTFYNFAGEKYLLLSSLLLSTYVNSFS